MRRILKYTIPCNHSLTPVVIKMPHESVFLKMSEQKGNISIWYEGDEDEELEPNSFICLHTGDILPSNRIEYIGTALFYNDSYVLHVYKLI